MMLNTIQEFLFGGMDEQMEEEAWLMVGKISGESSF